jgi:hypothetical protein
VLVPEPPVKARSVPFWRRSGYCSGVSWARTRPPSSRWSGSWTWLVVVLSVSRMVTAYARCVSRTMDVAMPPSAECGTVRPEGFEPPCRLDVDGHRLEPLGRSTTRATTPPGPPASTTSSRRPDIARSAPGPTR